MPRRAEQQRVRGIRYGRNRRGEVDRHAECTGHLQLILNNMRFIFITPRPVGHLKAASGEAAKVQGYMRERECWRGKCPGVRSNNAYEICVTAATGAVRSIVMPSAQDTCNSSETARMRMNCIGGRECKWSANSEPKSLAGSLQGSRWRGLASAYHRQPSVFGHIRGLAKTASVINFINPRARLDKSR